MSLSERSGVCVCRMVITHIYSRSKDKVFLLGLLQIEQDVGSMNSLHYYSRHITEFLFYRTFTVQSKQF